MADAAVEVKPRTSTQHTAAAGAGCRAGRVGLAGFDIGRIPVVAPFPTLPLMSYKPHVFGFLLSPPPWYCLTSYHTRPALLSIARVSAVGYQRETASPEIVGSRPGAIGILKLRLGRQPVAVLCIVNSYRGQSVNAGIPGYPRIGIYCIQSCQLAQFIAEPRRFIPINRFDGIVRPIMRPS